MKDKLDFIKRHATWLILALVGIAVLFAVPKIISFVLFCITMEALAIGLSSLASYAYTKLKFDDLQQGADLAPHEMRSNAEVLGKIFMSVHFLIGFLSMIFYSDTFR